MSRHRLRSILLSGICAAVAAPALAATRPLAPGTLVLVRGDLPTGFTTDRANTGVFSNERVAKAENNLGDLVKFRRWGRLTGYQAQFGRDQQAGRYGGVVLVISRVSVYASARGTAAAFADKRRDCAGTGIPPVAPPAGFGSQVLACSATQTSGGANLRAYAVFWGHGRVDGAVIVLGVADAISEQAAASFATGLAHVADARMARALAR